MPLEAVIAQQPGQWVGDGVVVVYEKTVIADEVEEHLHCAHRVQQRPIEHRLDLLLVHGDTTLEITWPR
jgi:hypothetical protein